MKTRQTREQDIKRAPVDAVIDGRIGALFRRIPMLCGFSLQEDLQPTEIAIHSWPGHVAGEELYDDIIVTVAEVITERPDAADLLRHRTFARRLQ